MGLGDTALEIVSLKNPAPRPQEAVVGYRMMAIEVESMEEAVAYLKGKGVEIAVEPGVASRRVEKGRDQRSRRAWHRTPAVVTGALRPRSPISLW